MQSFTKLNIYNKFPGLQPSGHFLNASGRQATVIRTPSVASRAAPEQASPLPPVLEDFKNACLIQARIGFGERGRGLFFVPPDVAAPAATTTTTTTTSTPQQLSQQQQQQQQQLHPSPLLAVPLSCCLALVTGPGGPVGLQRELLAQWQSYHGLTLPDRLMALLEATDRPPALRLVPWLLWVTQVMNRNTEDCGGSETGAGAVTGEEGPEGQQPQTRQLLLSEYARHVLPPPSTGASLLRLADDQERQLPEDLRLALRAVRAQVTSYISDLRSAGLDWGLGEELLWWAFDMVVSRSFATSAPLPPPSPPSASAAPSTTSGLNPGRFATSGPPPGRVSMALYVPWACLLNHSSSPNASFHADLAQRAFLVTPQRPDGLSYLPPKPIPPGQELCISYGEGLDNVQLAVRYGFCTAGNANDRLPLPPELAAAARGLRWQVLCSAAEEVADALPATTTATNGAEGSLEQRRARVFAALASLLDPVVLPSGSVVRSDLETISRGAGASALSALLAWSTGTSGSFAAGRSLNIECKAANLCIPESAQLPLRASCINLLRVERTLLTSCLQWLLQVYGNKFTSS